LKEYGDLNSKFKFVILASKRAKDLLKGAKPKVKSKSKNLIRIAQQEISQGLIDYELVQSKPEDLYEEEMFNEEYKEDQEESLDTIFEEKDEEVSDKKSKERKKAKENRLKADEKIKEEEEEEEEEEEATEEEEEEEEEEEPDDIEKED